MQDGFVSFQDAERMVQNIGKQLTASQPSSIVNQELWSNIVLSV